MNLLKAIAEIGVLEVSRVAAKHPECSSETSIYLPCADEKFVEQRIRILVDSIINLNKNSIFLMTPEIALVEELASHGWNGTTIIALPFDFDEDSVNRIKANTPLGTCVQFLTEGGFPSNFRPGNGAIICTGLTPSGYRNYIPPFSYRMMSLYKSFHGERILLSCSPESTGIPELGWIYVEDDFFTNVIPA